MLGEENRSPTDRLSLLSFWVRQVDPLPLIRTGHAKIIHAGHSCQILCGFICLLRKVPAIRSEIIFSELFLIAFTTDKAIPD